MIKLIRLVLLAAVVLGGTVLMALPRHPASEETAQLQSNDSNPASAVGTQVPTAGTAGSPSRPSSATPSGNAGVTGNRPSGPAGNGGPAVPTVHPTETGPIQPGRGAGATPPPSGRDVPGTTILQPQREPQGTARTVWPKQHTIQSGETLQKIAKRYYGGFSKWRRIADANPGVDPTRIRPGQKLKIPAPSAPR